MPEPEPAGEHDTISTYGDRTLPGRLLVNTPDGRAARVFDLTTGARESLPASPDSPESDRWTVSADQRTLVRWNVANWRTMFPLSFFDSVDLVATRAQVELPEHLEFKTPLLSFDGQALLTYFGDGYEVDERLTVFDASTATVLKRGSQLDDAEVISEPYAWLPDGRYVYLVGEKLFVSSKTADTSQLVATLDLPSNNSIEGGGFVAGHSELAVSPDGSHLAFTWWERRTEHVFDNHIYTVDVDGSNLRRLTRVADVADPLSYRFGSPTWSPDGHWIGFVLGMTGTTAAPVWPDEPFLGARVTGTTGCGTSPVYVLSSTSPQVAFTWPQMDTSHAVKVKSADHDGSGQWVTACGRIRWTR